MVSSALANATNGLRACAALLALTFGAAHAAPFAYISNRSSNNVSVVDTANNALVSTIGVGAAPYGVVVNAAGTRAYVVNRSSNNMSVINTATNSVVATVAVGSGPFGVAINPAGTRVYATNNGGNSVSVIDTSINSVVATVPVGSLPYGVAVTPDGARVYVPNYSSNTVSVINTATNTVIATIGAGSLPFSIAINPAGTRAYVTNLGGDNVSVINTSTNTVIGSIAIGPDPYGVTVNPAGTRAYVAVFGAARVAVINTATNTVIANVPVGSSPYGIGVNPAGTRVYVANNSSNTVSVIDTATDGVVATVAVGIGPIAYGGFFFGTPPVVGLPPQSPADNNPRKAGGYIANGAANCRGASDADRAVLVAEPNGLHNPTAAMPMVVCNQPSDEFARSSGNATPLAAGMASFHIVFSNRGGVARTMDCTGTAGRATTAQFVRNKTVSVPAGGRAGIAWTAVGDNAGVPFERPTDITCVLLRDIQINETFNRYFREVGDFTPVP